MELNNAGKMVEKWYYELENKFPDIKCREMIVMPNHFHCVVEIVGADLRVCPNIPHNTVPNTQSHFYQDNTTEFPHALEQSKISEQPILGCSDILGEQPILVERPKWGEYEGLGEHVGSPLHRVVQWFKTMTTNEYIRGVKTLHWKRFDGKLWQRNYYEHVIRNGFAYGRIANYILNNPSKWHKDTFNAQ